MALPARRALSGAVGGLLAGLALLAVLALTGDVATVVAFTPLGSGAAVVVALLGSSLLLGLLFAALPVTGGWARGLGWGLVYGAAVWVVLDMVLVRPWSGLPVALTEGAWLGLAGRLVWGAVLGLSFVGLMLGTFRLRERRRPLPGA